MTVLLVHPIKGVRVWILFVFLIQTLLDIGYDDDNDDLFHQILRIKIETIQRSKIKLNISYNNCRYDDSNTEKLREAARNRGVETNIFYFDPKDVHWEDYFMNTHLPGLVKYVFK